MSEVKKYLIQKTPFGTLMKAHAQGNWVGLSDYDAALAIEASLREELARLKVAAANVIVEGDALQQRLTIAEQRSSELESAAREMLRIAAIANQGSNVYNREIINLNSTLNPVEGEGS